VLYKSKEQKQLRKQKNVPFGNNKGTETAENSKPEEHLKTRKRAGNVWGNERRNTDRKNWQ
jgi:hypothetical protein